MAKKRNRTAKLTPKTGLEYVITIGDHIDALIIALELAHRAKDETIVMRLTDMGIKKDKYYARLRELNKLLLGQCNIDINVAIEAEYKSRHDGIPNEFADLFRQIAIIRDQYRKIGEQRKDSLRIRLGTPPILCRSMVAPVLSAFRDQFDERNPAPEIDLEIEISGRLKHLSNQNLLDIYIRHSDSTREHTAHIELPYCLVCAPGHNAANYIREHPGMCAPMSTLNDSTLVLVGAHVLRDHPFRYPRDQIEYRSKGIRIVEVDVFDKAHSMVACGGSKIATLSFPEFLDDDLVRRFDIVTNHELLNLMKASESEGTLKFCVERGISLDSQQVEKDKMAAVVKLESAFKHHLEQINPLKDSAIETMSKPRVMYYVRTGKTRNDHAWAHSSLQWQFLRTGHVKGIDLVDRPRDPDGKSKGTNQRYRIFGRLIPEITRDDKCHLVWTGLDDQNEAYVASFICTKKSLERSDQAIVGTWSGRSNDIHYKSSSGFMVITDWELSEHPTVHEQREILDSLTDEVKRFRIGHSGDGLQDPPTKWEWELHR